MAETVRPIRIFYSYAHEDQAFVNELETHLMLLRRSHLIEPWSYQDISAGTEWESTIASQLNKADIILLLISPDFMASDYTYGKEMRRAMERHEQGTARVIPIILSPTIWHDTPFGKLQVLPKGGKSVIRWANRDEAFNEIVKGIREVALELQKSLAVQIDWVDRGGKLIEDGRYEEALDAFEQAIRLEPNKTDAYIGKGDVLSSLGQTTEALFTYEQAIRLEPDNASAYIMRGRALRDLGRFVEALSSYQQAIQLAPSDAVAYNEMGIVLSDLQRYEEAIATYQHALRLSPTNNSVVYLSLGNTLRLLARYEEALEAYERASQISSNDINIEICKGDLFLQLQRYEQALRAYTTAVNIDSKNVPVRLSMGEALLQLRRYEEALSVFDTAIILEPNNTRAYEKKATILRILGYADESAYFTQQAIHQGSNIAASFNLRDEAIEIRASQARVELVQQFLRRAGFDLEVSFSEIGFPARVKISTWKKYFPGGLYICVLLDTTLDQRTVRAISRDAKSYGMDHALVIINQQPDFSGTAEINILRWEQGSRHFVCLPIDEALILEGIATHKEQLEFQKYVTKRLGHGFDPYSVVDPVSDAVSFFGRQRLTEELSDALRRGQRLGLFGIQKMGKSSVLQQLRKRIEFPVAYVYLKTNDTLDRIYRRILEDWALNSRIKYPTEFKWVAPQFLPDSITPSNFDDTTKSLIAYLSAMTGVSPMLGIFLDEIEHIVPDKGDEETLQLYVDLMDSLRGLYQETQSISLLIAGVHPGIARYNYFWGNQKNPMYQIIAERFLSPLDEEDCKNMISSLGQQINLQYDKRALDYILEMSGAHPFLARRLCSLACKRHRDLRSVSVEMIGEAVQEFVTNPELNSYFDERGLWGELSQPDLWKDEVGKANHELLLRLAAANQELSENELCARLDRNVAKEALYALKERSLITSPNNSGYYHITFGLLRNWIRFRQLGMALD